LAEQTAAPFLKLALAHGSAHQLGDDRALVLVTESLVKVRFHFVRHAEINRCHELPRLLKVSTISIGMRRAASTTDLQAFSAKRG
jgi:hypothetical protein